MRATSDATTLAINKARRGWRLDSSPKPNEGTPLPAPCMNRLALRAEDEGLGGRGVGQAEQQKGDEEGERSWTHRGIPPWGLG